MASLRWSAAPPLFPLPVCASSRRRARRRQAAQRRCLFAPAGVVLLPCRLGLPMRDGIERNRRGHVQRRSLPARIPGGMPGSVRLRDNEILQRIMVRQAEEKRLHGAICAAPAVVLMPWGLHKGRKITCHPSFIGDLPSFRAVESNVQVSGELTTSRGPGTAFQFALSFVEQLFGPHAVEDVDSTLIDAGLERSTEVNRVEWPFDHKPQVLIPIANGSEEMEIIMLVDILRRANINVVLASVDESTNIVGSQRMKIVADKCILGASDSKYDLIIIPGGPAGAERLHRCTTLKKLLKEQKEAGRMYGGICYSPLILQKQGLLQDKTVTAHPSVVNQLTCQVIDRSKVVFLEKEDDPRPLHLDDACGHFINYSHKTLQSHTTARLKPPSKQQLSLHLSN